MASKLQFSTKRTERPNSPKPDSGVVSIFEPIRVLLAGRGYRSLSFDEKLEFLRLAVDEVWGHSTLERGIVNDNQFNIQAHCEQMGWRLDEEGTMYGIFKDKEEFSLKFGERPDNKTLKNMAKAKEAAKKKAEHDAAL